MIDEKPQLETEQLDAARRRVLQGSLGAGAMGLAVGAGLLSPQALLAAWPEAAFKAKDQAAALSELLGSDAVETSDAINIKAPDIAENGAVVPVTVSTDLEGVKTITIFAMGNQAPLIASFELAEQAAPFVSTRIKMAKTADVVAVVQTQDGLLSNSKEVKVTIGGCGG
ncbi:thiosulfate oxidation carrier protein SoxY [Rhabdochromatium marinum]|uniref:thiosulfate oxidation carrier protein SoxY n=1 Tax=Rhabdochromatium marinum TaxID=48729 RepID=UPI001904B7F2|nr:thiosulfate oxidation carrier protein SoxY [Rhabdochromatium marinum]MBK1648202.1 thiosulfate oxidation carrier protein SoxY [Rhabdochromatium marinum]